jgi:dipeptidyl aminopeptidase/acylaminoacyl peptidase
MNLTLLNPRRLVVALIFLACLTPLHAGEKTGKRPITLDDLWRVKRLGKPAISPDGKWVAVELTTYSMDDNSSTSHLWLLSTDGKTQKQLTTAKGGASGPVWSADGKSIAFVSKRDQSIPSPSGRGAGGEGVPQIYVISPVGGEAKQVSNLPMAPSGLKWSHDGKTLYCVVMTWPDTPDDDSYRKKEKAKKDDKVQAYVIDDALYRVWDHWIADGKRPVVYAVNVESGKHKNLFAHTKVTLPASGGSGSDYDVSPDGSEICFTAESAKELGMDNNLDLYVMPISEASRERKRPEDQPVNITTDNTANDFAPVYSPNGKMVAFLRTTTKFFYADRSRIMVHYRAKLKNFEVTADLDRSCSNVQWRPDNHTVYFEAEDAGYHRLFTASIFGKETPVPLMGGNDSDQALSLSANGLTVAFLRSNFGMPASLYAFSLGGKQAPQRIESFNDALRAEWDLGPTKDVTIKGADDDPVQMWIVYPPQFDPKKKYPLVQFVHGGPHNGITTDFHYRWNMHLIASKGYVVACVNFHGSSGFGQKFTDSITGDMATKPYIDVMKATDYMEKEPYIDKNRMAAVGASYGGYMMAWLNGHTDRFKAMVCHAGVYNWHSMMASDFVRGRERPLGAFPWGDQTKIDKQSPQRYAAGFKTPTLVTHGEKDYRVPITQGFEYYNTLRIKGVPTRLVYFPDENHWILKPQNARLWNREFFAWLDKYIGQGPTK